MCRKSRRPTRSWKGQIYAKIADLEKRQAVAAQMWVYYSKTGNNSSKSKPHQMFQHFKVQAFQMFLAGFHIYSPFLAIFIASADFLVFTTSEFHDLNSCNCCVCFHFNSFPFLWFDIRLSCADSVKWEEINNSGRYFCTVLSPPRIINFHFVFIWSKLLEQDLRIYAYHEIIYIKKNKYSGKKGMRLNKIKTEICNFVLNFESQNPSGSASPRVNS